MTAWDLAALGVFAISLVGGILAITRLLERTLDSLSRSIGEVLNPPPPPEQPAPVASAEHLFDTELPWERWGTVEPNPPAESSPTTTP